MQANDPREVRLRQAFAKNPEKTVARLTANDAPLIDALIQSFESRAQNYAQTGYSAPESITRPLTLLQQRKAALEAEAVQKPPAAEEKRKTEVLRQQQAPIPSLAEALDLTPTNADPLGDGLQQRADIADEQGQTLKRTLAALQIPAETPEQQRQTEEDRRLVSARLAGELVQQGVIEQAQRTQAQADIDAWIGSGGRPRPSGVIGRMGMPLGQAPAPETAQPAELQTQIAELRALPAPLASEQARLKRLENEAAQRSGQDELSRLLGPAPTPQAPPVAPPAQPQSLADFLQRDSTAGAVPSPLRSAEGPLAAEPPAAPRPKRTQAEIKAMQGQRENAPVPKTPPAPDEQNLEGPLPPISDIPQLTLDELDALKSRFEQWLEQHGDEGTLAEFDGKFYETIIPVRSNPPVQAYQRAIDAAIFNIAFHPEKARRPPAPPSPQEQARQQQIQQAQAQWEQKLAAREAEVAPLQQAIEARIAAIKDSAKTRKAAGEDPQALLRELGPLLTEARAHQRWLNDYAFTATERGHAVNPRAVGAQWTPLPESLRTFAHTPAPDAAPSSSTPPQEVPREKGQTETSPLLSQGQGLPPSTEAGGGVMSEEELARRGQRVRDYVDQVKAGTAKHSSLRVGVIGNDAAQRMVDALELPVDGSMEIVIADAAIHATREHPDMTGIDWEQLPRLTNQFDDVELGRSGQDRKVTRILVKKTFPDGTGYGAVLDFAKGGKRKRLNLVTYFKGRGKSLEAWWDKNKQGFDSSGVPNRTEPASNAPRFISKPDAHRIPQPAESSSAKQAQATPPTEDLDPFASAPPLIALSPETLAGYQNTAGWAERGGRLLRDESGQVTGRTTWLPRDAWWAAYKASGKGTLNEAQAKAALQAAIDGQPLNEKAQALLEFLADYDAAARQRDAESQWIEDQLSTEEQALLDRLEAELADHPAFGREKRAAFLERIAQKHETLTPAQFGRAPIKTYEAQLNALRTAEAESAGRTEVTAEGAPSPVGEGAGLAPGETPLLTDYTLAELDAENARVQSEIEQQRQADAAAEAKRQADKEVSGFTLTGSNRPADVALANGKTSLLDAMDGKAASKGAQKFAASTPSAVTDALKALAGNAAVQNLIGKRRLRVVAKQSDLPSRVVIPAGQRVAGAVDPDTGVVYLIAENIAPDEIAGFLAHEVGVHQAQLGLNQPKSRALRLAHALARLVGARQILGDASFNDALAQLQRMRATSKPVQAAYAAAQHAMGSLNQSSALLHEEALAYLVQNHPKTSLAQQIIAAVRAFLYRAGVRMNLTENDLHALAVSALRGMAQGKNRRGTVSKGVWGTIDSRKPWGQAPGLFEKAPVKITRLTGKEISDAIRPWDLRNAVKEFAQQYRGQSYFNADTKTELTVGKEGYRHLFGGNKTLPELQAAAALPELIRNAVLADIHADRKGEAQIQEMWRLYAPLEIEGQLYRVKLTVKNRVDKIHQFHEIDALQIESPPVNAREVVVNDPTPYHGRPEGRSELSIAQLLQSARRDSDGQPFSPDNADIRFAYSLGQAEPNLTAEEVLQRIEAGGEVTAEEFALLQAYLSGASRALAATGVDAPSFKDWFGASKIKGKTGQPVKMYHGTASDFTVFDAAASGSSTKHPTAALGFFFTNDRAHAAEKYGDRVMEVYLAIEKPYVMTDADLRRIDTFEDALAFRRKLEAQGYDGVALPAETQTRYVVAFRPDQIKRTTNETYTRGEKDMRFAHVLPRTGQAPGLFEKAPVVVTQLTGQEFGENLSKPALAKAADALLRTLQAGSPLTNHDTGWDLVIGKQDRRKMGDNADQTPTDSKAVAGLVDLVRYAVLAESHPDQAHQNPEVSAIHRLYAPVQIGNRLYRVKLTVKDYATAYGRRNLHALESVEIENALPGTLPAPSLMTSQQAQPTTGRTTSITHLLAGAIRDSDGQPFAPESSVSATAPRFALANPRPLTPEQQAAMDKIGRRDPQGWGQRFAGLRERIGLKLRQAIADHHAALLELDRQAYGNDVVENQTAAASWVKARLSRSVDGPMHFGAGSARSDTQRPVARIAARSVAKSSSPSVFSGCSSGAGGSTNWSCRSNTATSASAGSLPRARRAATRSRKTSAAAPAHSSKMNGAPCRAANSRNGCRCVRFRNVASTSTE